MSDLLVVLQTWVREASIHLALVDQIAKATVLLLLAWGLVRLMRKASASARHQIWTAALVGVLLLPLLSLALPSWHVPALSAGAEALFETSFETAPKYHVNRIEAELPSVAAPAPGRVLVHSTGKVVSHPGASRGLAGVSTWLVLGWAAGALFFSLRLLISYLAAWKVSRDAVPVTDGDLKVEVEDLRRQLNIRFEVRLVEHSKITMPMAWGLIRQTILLPEAARSWTPERRRVVLLHELAHLKRWDCRTVLPARVVTALHWFNPLAWIAMSRLQAEREFACDDLVLTAGTPGPDYAQHLLDIARAMQPSLSPGLAMVAMARPSELEGRLLAILDPNLDRGRKGRMTRVAGLLTIGLLVLPLASLQPRANAEAGSSENGDSEPGDVGGKSMDSATKARVLEAFSAALRDDDPDVRAQAAHALGSIEDRSSVARLNEAIRDDSEQVRAQAAWALGMLEDPSAVPALTAVLADPSVDVRRQAVWALGMIQSEVAVPELNAVIGDADAGVRQQAAWALGMIESDRAVGVLERALADDEAPVREQAAWALGMIEGPSAIGSLSSVLADDPSPKVRRQAAWALGMIGHESALDVLLNAMSDSDKDVQKQAFWAVGQISD